MADFHTDNPKTPEDAVEKLTSGGVTREEAFPLIEQKAISEGIKGNYKVKYKGEEVVSPRDLPEIVNMEDVEVYSVLHQA